MKGNVIANKTNAGGRAVIVLICLYLILPLALTFLYSVFRQWNGLLPRGFTLEYYARAFEGGGLLVPLLRTVGVSFLAVGICTLAVLCAVYVTSVAAPRFRRVMQILCTIPYALQGIILAIGALSLYAGAPPPFGNRIFMLAGVYSVCVLPYIYRSVENSLGAVNARGLIESAQILGLTPFRAYFRVVVPGITKGIKVSVLLAVSLLFGDFVMVNIIGGSYFETAQMYLYERTFQSGQLASAIIVVLFAVTLVISGSVFIWEKKPKRDRPQANQADSLAGRKRICLEDEQEAR